MRHWFRLNDAFRTVLSVAASFIGLATFTIFTTFTAVTAFHASVLSVVQALKESITPTSTISNEVEICSRAAHGPASQSRIFCPTYAAITPTNTSVDAKPMLNTTTVPSPSITLP